jgi:hypothetical protein
MATTFNIYDTPDLLATFDVESGINDFQPEVWSSLADFDNDFFDFDEYANFDTSCDSNPQPS